MTQIFSSAVLPNVAKLSLVVFLYSTWVYRSVSCQTKKKDWFSSITSKELVDILRRLVVKCQGWTVSTTLLNAQTENLFWLYLQGVAGYQSTPRASRGENLNFFPLQIHLSILQIFNVIDEQDVEDFTPLHPDVLTAPEMAHWVQAGKKKMGEVNFVIICQFYWQKSAEL